MGISEDICVGNDLVTPSNLFTSILNNLCRLLQKGSSFLLGHKA